MPTETSITCLGSHLIGCEHCSAESGEYCNEFTRLFAELFGFIPSESDTSLLPESPQNTPSVPWTKTKLSKGKADGYRNNDFT